MSTPAAGPTPPDGNGLRGGVITSRLGAESAHMPNATTTARSRIERAYERGNAWTQKLLVQIRPRVSLASGSLLVLLTLFLPIGYEACGPRRTGYELMAGEGGWPTFLCISYTPLGQDFYRLVLLLASFTLLLALVFSLRPGVMRNRLLAERLVLLSGALSLFLVSDTTALLAVTAGDQASPAAFIPFIASCLAPGLFWPRRSFLAWVGVIASAVSLLFILDILGMSDGQTMWILLGTGVIYSLVPLGLWYRYGFAPRPEARAQSEVILRGVVAFYFPAVLGNFWFLGVAIKEGVWGFVPCYFGIHLIALGYLRLKQEHMLHSVEPTPDQP